MSELKPIFTRGGLNELDKYTDLEQVVIKKIAVGAIAVGAAEGRDPSELTDPNNLLADAEHIKGERQVVDVIGKKIDNRVQITGTIPALTDAEAQQFNATEYDIHEVGIYIAAKDAANSPGDHRGDALKGTVLFAIVVSASPIATVTRNAQVVLHFNLVLREPALDRVTIGASDTSADCQCPNPATDFCKVVTYQWFSERHDTGVSADDYQAAVIGFKNKDGKVGFLQLSTQLDLSVDADTRHWLLSAEMAGLGKLTAWSVRVLFIKREYISEETTEIIHEGL